MPDRNRHKPNLANRVDEATEDVVVKSATDYPAYGQARTSNELLGKKCQHGRLNFSPLKCNPF